MRLEEVSGKDLENQGRQKHSKTDYEKMVAQLNGAARKKADLVKFCEEKLRMSNMSGYTIPRIQQLAMVRIYELSEPDPRDKIGFGKYAEADYEEIYSSDPAYCQWVMETARNPGAEGCCHRLRRLAGWLESQKKKGIKPEPRSLAALTPNRRRATRGTSSQSPGSSTGLLDSTPEIEKRMEKMMDTIEKLRDEVVALKGEPTRKKELKSEDDQNRSPEPKVM